MSAPLVLPAQPDRVRPISLRLENAFRELWPAALVMVLAILAQSLRETSSDVSWLITLCEKTLAGETPYVDFIESNPPVAFLIYMPGTWLARLIGVSPELMVSLLGFLAIIVSLGLAFLIFRQARLSRQIGPAGLTIAVLVLALLPGESFNQREHLALIFGVPLLATFAGRAAGGAVDLWLRVIAGIGGAVMVSIKPHFALTFIAVLPYFARRIGFKAFLASVELITLAVFSALSLISIFVFFPAYIQTVVPIAAAVYVPVRLPMIELLLNQGFLWWAALGFCLVLLGRGRLSFCLVAVPALASVGAIVTFLIQGKGWPYHSYPAVALIALAIGPLVAQRATQRTLTIVALILFHAALIFAYVLISRPSRDVESRLEWAIATLTPHPKILTIGAYIQLGFPLTRNVSGVWVGRPMDLWITTSIEYLTRKIHPDDATRQLYDSYLRLDRAMLVEAIHDRKPDAIVVQNKAWKSWAFAQDDVAAALADYEPVDGAGPTIVFARKPGLRPTQ